MFWKKILCICFAVIAMGTGPMALGATRDFEIQMGNQEFTTLLQQEGGADVIHPELSAYVQWVGDRLAKVSDRPDLPYQFVVVDNTDLNAFAVSGGKIGINLGLLMHLKSEAEMASVLAHEIGHATASHALQQADREYLLWGVHIGVQQLLQNYWITKGVDVGNRLIEMACTRASEREADVLGLTYLARAGYAPKASVDVKRLYIKTFPEESEGGFSALFASHPSFEQRIADETKQIQTLPQKGNEGRVSYQRMLSPIKATLPAYRALKEGRIALGKGNPQKALLCAQRGLSIEPQEPRLLLLEAQALSHLKRPHEALESLNAALGIQPHYYALYRERARIYTLLKQPTLAARDEKSAQSLIGFFGASYHFTDQDA